MTDEELRSAIARADARIRATYALDILDAAIESLPPECRPRGLDPALCGHDPEERWHSPNGRRTLCTDCGTWMPEGG